MDTGKDDGEREEEIKREIEKWKKKIQGESFVIDFDRLRKTNKLVAQQTLDTLDKAIHSNLHWKGNHITYLEMFQSIIKQNTLTSEFMLDLLEYTNSLRDSILSLYLLIEGTKGSTIKEIDDLKSRIKKFLDDPSIHRIGVILDNMQKVAEQREKQAKELYRG